MKKILVLIDLKRDTENCCMAALKIACQLKANIIVAILHTTISLVEELHGADVFLPEENHYSNLEEVADYIKSIPLSNGAFTPAIECNDLKADGHTALKEFVVKNSIWMIIQGMPVPPEANAELYKDSIIDLAAHINCPRLFLTEHFSMNLIDKIAYFTDLRYCDTGVIKFLKSFDAFIFITHLSARGLPDIEQRYAQEILSDGVAVKSCCRKLFLRNIKRADYFINVEKVIETDDIKMCAVVSKKHGLLEELLSSTVKIQSMHKLPLLVIPFLNWFTV